MTQMSQLPNQAASLPPSFITSFVRKCFAADLMHVDFPQSLTGLDYLKDLETRRRREVANALNRLGIRRETLGTTEDDISARYPGVLSWFRSLEDVERKIEALYTQLYVGLRRWVSPITVHCSEQVLTTLKILINELSLTPFNKHNCVAMLNTLYPPVSASQPTSKLTPTILKRQRDGFFKYIQGVEKSGPRILVNLMQQGKRQGEENGWPAVRATLDMYLQHANAIIGECLEIADMDDVAMSAATNSKRNGRKVDSGVSFNSNESRPSTSSSKDSFERPALRAKPSLNNMIRSGSTLEKIARELRNMGRKPAHVDEIMPSRAPTPSGPANASDNKSVFEGEAKKAKGLRKIRSLGALGNLRASNSSSASLPAVERKKGETPAFNVEEMKRQRLIYEAKQAKIQMTGMAMCPM